MTENDPSTNGIYRPYGDNCTVHNCDEAATRHVCWNGTDLIAGFCDQHAESKLAVSSTSEYSVDAGMDQ